jgi:hypothetical protein
VTVEPLYARETWADALEVEARTLDNRAAGAAILAKLATDSYRGPASRAAVDAMTDAAQLLRERAAELRLPRVIE